MPQRPRRIATPKPIAGQHLPVGPTIHDVARESGVSAATVSRILNNRHRGAGETRDRVQATALALGYVPHAGHRASGVPRHGALGVLLPDLSGEFFSEFLRGIDDTAHEHGIHLLVTSTHADHAQLQAASAAMRERVDGFLIVAPGRAAETTIRELSQLTPTVVVGLDMGQSGVPSLMIDNAGGATAVAEYALSNGYRHLAIITGADSQVDAVARRDAFRAAVRGATYEVTLQEFAGDFSQESGWNAAHTMLAQSPRPEFVFACNDSMAIGAMSALRDADVRVPEAIAVAGFDDVPMARYLTPALTTVQVPIEELGRRAMRSLITAVLGGAPRRSACELVGVSLVARGSTIMMPRSLSL